MSWGGTWSRGANREYRAAGRLPVIAEQSAAADRAAITAFQAITPLPAARLLSFGVRQRVFPIMDDYSKRLTATKGCYPFAKWAASGLEQYTDEACSLFKAVFDDLIQRLAALGEHAPETEKIVAFKQAVGTLNALNEKDESLIETGEREDLCELCNVIATAAGIDPSKYGDGEGPASEWREW